MKKIFNNLFWLLVLVFLVYYFRDTLSAGYTKVQRQYFPCTDTVYYSLGEFDTKFGLSQEEFLKYLNDAATKWNKASGRELLAYSENSNFKVDLVYDKRQAVTDVLDDIGGGLDKNKTIYNELKEKYNTSMALYKSSKVAFEKDWASFTQKNSEYNQRVQAVNAEGGASPEEYAALTAEREKLNTEEAALKNMETSLNKSVANVNQLAKELNSLAQELNLDVARYNAIGEMQDDEFEEGRYYREGIAEGIEIYQFDDLVKLQRVLAHEFGHALGVEHVDDKEAIMYFLNTSGNTELTDSDKSALLAVCHLEK